MRALAALACLSGPACALDMPVPATRTVLETEPFGSHRFATGPHADTLPAEVAEGAVTREIWTMPAPATTLELLAPLRAALMADGWQVALDCEMEACGGYDFRFEIDVTPAPDMFVDLADFRYLSAQKDDAWTSLIVSRSGEVAYVQTTRVDPSGAVEPVVKSASNPPAPLPSSDIGRQLAMQGHAVLPGVAFAPGATTLSGDFPPLADLAAYLRDTPGVTVALVGHTDATGGAEGNLALSRLRAEAVRARLVERYDIAADRLESHGAGYFAPLARNDTEDGRRTNRRVEVVVTSTP